MGFNFVGSHPTPHTPFLTGADRIGATRYEKGTICTQGFGRLDSLFSDYPVWQVLGEENLGEPLAGHFSHPFDG